LRVNKQYGLAIFLALAVMLVVACRSAPTPVPTEVPTAVPTVAAPTNTPEPTATTAPTNTPVPTATIALPTNTPEPTLAPTPVPTIDLEAAKSDQPPHVFVGTAKINGVAAPRGTIISALIGGQIAATGLVEDAGKFTAIKVEIPGYPVTFQIGDLDASQPPITTVIGEATVLDLNASRN